MFFPEIPYKEMQSFDSCWRQTPKQKIYLWGDFPYLEEAPLFRPLHLPSPVALLSCGSEHIVFSTAGGRLFGLGSNRCGQLALGSENLEVRGTPAQLPAPTATPLRQVCCGGQHTLVVDQDSSVFGCGQGQYGAVGAGTRANCAEWAPVAVGIDRVSCGARHSIGVNRHGRVYGWGETAQGQLGLATENKCLLRPVSLEVQRSVVEVSAAGNISVFLLEDGRVVGCGGNHLGQLGLGHKSPVLEPTALSFRSITRVRAGNYTVGISQDQSVYFAGSGAFGELLYPVKIYLKNPEEVFVGETCGFAKDAQGKVYGWGSNLSGELGETQAVKGYSQPTELPML